MELLVQMRDDRRIAVLACEDHCRVARQELLQAEDQHRYEEERRNDRREAMEQVVQHFRRAEFIRPRCCAKRVRANKFAPTKSVGFRRAEFIRPSCVNSSSAPAPAPVRREWCANRIACWCTPTANDGGR